MADHQGPSKREAVELRWDCFDGLSPLSASVQDRALRAGQRGRWCPSAACGRDRLAVRIGRRSRQAGTGTPQPADSPWHQGSRVRARAGPGCRRPTNQPDERRLLYVAMTRAKETLTLFSSDPARQPHAQANGRSNPLTRRAIRANRVQRGRRSSPQSSGSSPVRSLHAGRGSPTSAGHA
jgi:hypothetical protein